MSGLTALSLYDPDSVNVLTGVIRSGYPYIVYMEDATTPILVPLPTYSYWANFTGVISSSSYDLSGPSITAGVMIKAVTASGEFIVPFSATATVGPSVMISTTSTVQTSARAKISAGSALTVEQQVWTPGTGVVNSNLTITSVWILV